MRLDFYQIPTQMRVPVRVKESLSEEKWEVGIEYRVQKELKMWVEC